MAKHLIIEIDSHSAQEIYDLANVGDVVCHRLSHPQFPIVSGTIIHYSHFEDGSLYLLKCGTNSSIRWEYIPIWISPHMSGVMSTWTLDKELSQVIREFLSQFQALHGLHLA